MSDEIDQANDRVELDSSIAIALAHLAAGKIPKGEPGECDLCGEHSERLVGGCCAPCRDRWGRP
jgi:hypothetical protein